jgi:hypothetical protein
MVHRFQRLNEPLSLFYCINGDHIFYDVMCLRIYGHLVPEPCLVKRKDNAAARVACFSAGA